MNGTQYNCEKWCGGMFKVQTVAFIQLSIAYSHANSEYILSASPVFKFYRQKMICYDNIAFIKHKIMSTKA